MTPFLIFICLIHCVVSKAVSFHKISAPKIVAVMSMQRSGSTSLNTLLSSHPCGINGNEIMTADKGQDILGAHKATGMSQKDSHSNPVDFLMRSHEMLCKTHSQCGGDCTIFVKIFDVHVLSNEGLTEMAMNEDIGYIVLERDVHESYESLQNALNHKDWLTVPGQKRPDKEVYTITDKYLDRQRNWYEKVRGLLKDFGRTYVEVSFVTVQSCDILHDVLPSIYSFFGMQLYDNIDVNSKSDSRLYRMKEFIDSCSR